MTTLPHLTLEQAQRHWHPQQAPDGAYEIELFLKNIADVFETMVPLPLPYIDVDSDIVDYLIEQIGEVPKNAKVRLVLRLPADVVKAVDEEQLRGLFTTYVEMRLVRHRKEESNALSEVIRSFIWGFAFMLLCQVIRWLADFPDHPTITQTISEGMLVLGWVALWNPYDRFLFGWVPAVKKRRVITRISQMELIVRETPFDLSGLRSRSSYFGRKTKKEEPQAGGR